MLPAALFSIVPALLLVLWCWAGVRGTLVRGAGIASEAGRTGADVASFVLTTAGIQDVAVESGHGWQGSHYRSGARVLRLPPDVHGGRSLAALALAAHESGHAIQQRHGDGGLDLRNAAVPLSVGGWALGVPGFVVGLLLGVPALALFGALVFVAVVALQLLALPAEIRASRRAAGVLHGSRLVRDADEDREVKTLLTAAALRSLASPLSGPFAWWASRREVRRTRSMDV